MPEIKRVILTPRISDGLSARTRKVSVEETLEAMKKVAEAVGPKLKAQHEFRARSLEKAPDRHVGVA